MAQVNADIELEVRWWVRPMIRFVGTMLWPLALIVGHDWALKIAIPPLGYIIGRWGYQASVKPTSHG